MHTANQTRWLMTVIFVSAFVASAMEVDKAKVFLETIEDYNQCFDAGLPNVLCQDALLRWVDKHPGDALRAAKLSRQRVGHAQSIPFFAVARERKELDCSDEGVRLAVTAALSLSPEGNESIISQAKVIVFEGCLSTLGQVVASEAKVNDLVLRNSCKTLVKEKLLEGVAAKRCLKL